MNYLFILIFSWQLGHQSVQPKEVESFLEKDVTIVDVRTPEEFADGALPNAQNVSVTALSFLSEIQQYDKEDPILIYCKSGVRSARAILIMKTLGFNQIYELEGGYMAWKKEQ